MLTAVACLLCLPWVACQPEGNSTPSPYNLASFHGSFIPMDDLNPPAPQQSFGPNTTYWMKAGEQLKLEWDTYNLGLRLRNVERARNNRNSDRRQPWENQFAVCRLSEPRRKA